MSLQHTPGPWIISADPLHFHSLTTVIGGKESHQKNGPPQQMIIQVGGFAEWQEAEANARLIAAAPDLLEALSKFVEFAEQNGEVVFAGGGMPVIDAMNACTTKARAAIAKAAGGQS